MVSLIMMSGDDDDLIAEMKFVSLLFCATLIGDNSCAVAFEQNVYYW